jgi:hypothetical protein
MRSIITRSVSGRQQNRMQQTERFPWPSLQAEQTSQSTSKLSQVVPNIVCPPQSDLNPDPRSDMQRPFNELLQYYAMERFLYRLS